jgi:hypothetical protein
MTIPSLNLAIDRLRATGVSIGASHFAVHVINAPYRAGYLLQDVLWEEAIAKVWGAWQEMFAMRSVPMVPYLSGVLPQQDRVVSATDTPVSALPYSVRLMQTLGIHLWQWLFSGSIQTALNQSQGIAMGRNQPLRVRLDVRDPDLIGIPWEIMQSQAGMPAIALGQQVLFSRTISDVGALPTMRSDQTVNVLVVLGQDATIANGPVTTAPPETSTVRLRLEQEALALRQVLQNVSNFATTAGCFVDTLVQPTPAELLQKLNSGRYNVLFYAGHGVPAPDGGMLFLSPTATMNGTELAQVLARVGVKLAVFNACWGALPDQRSGQTIPRSSLAEVLLHHGVPAVLAMRDSITDDEALAFVQTFAQALAERLTIDHAVAIARQNLLTLFKFNQQAWTLPVLYMHPEFDGELVKPLAEGLTQIPMNPTQFAKRVPVAGLRSIDKTQTWILRGGLMSVGISDENDVVLNDPGVSRRHAEIFCRNGFTSSNEVTYFLKDLSRYGTWVLDATGWQKINHQEVQLFPGMQVKFGGSQNMAIEFVVDREN